jgi:hypothetical protein
LSGVLPFLGRAHQLLLDEGWQLNRKLDCSGCGARKASRVLQERGKRERPGESTVRAERLRVEAPDRVWAIDFHTRRRLAPGLRRTAASLRSRDDGARGVRRRLPHDLPRGRARQHRTALDHGLAAFDGPPQSYPAVTHPPPSLPSGRPMNGCGHQDRPETPHERDNAYEIQTDSVV